MPTIADYLLAASPLVVRIGLFVRLVNNQTGLAYVSVGSTDANGLFTITNAPPGQYTVYTGPSASGPWTATGDANYEVAPTLLPFVAAADYGALGIASGDDTVAIQAAIDATLVGGLRGGTVLLNPGIFPISAPLNMYAGVRLVGSGSAWDNTNHRNTTLRAANGFSAPGNGIVYGVEGNAGGFMHWSSVENLVVDGNNVASMRGINYGQFGETAYLRNICAYRCLDSGIYISGNQASCFLEHINPIANGIGVNLDNIGFNVHIKGLSGDNNGLHLLRVKGGISACVVVEGLKIESGSTAVIPTGYTQAQLQDTAIMVDALNGGMLRIIGGLCQSDDATVRTNVVKIQTGTGNKPQVILEGLYAAGYTNMLNDAVDTITVPLTLDGFNRPFIYHNVKPFISDLSAVVLGELGGGIKARASSGAVTPVVNPTTSDNLDLQDPLGGTNAVRSLSTFTTLKDHKRSSQAVTLNGGTVTIDAKAGELCLCALSASTTLAISNPSVGQELTLRIIHANDANTYTITKPATVKLVGGAFGNTQAANAIDEYVLMHDGTNWNEKSRALNLS